MAFKAGLGEHECTQGGSDGNGGGQSSTAMLEICSPTQTVLGLSASHKAQQEQGLLILPGMGHSGAECDPPSKSSTF